MMRVGHGPTKHLQDLNSGAFDLASHAPQLRSCVCVCVCVSSQGHRMDG